MWLATARPYLPSANFTYPQNVVRNSARRMAKTYIEYLNGERRDEDKLISPILLRKFLEDVLGFRLGESIYAQERKKGGKPDYIPIDIRTHPFVFDAKGTDTGVHP